MQLVSLPGVVPPQPVIHGQFWRGLPVVLSIEAAGLLAPLDLLGSGNGGGVGKPQQETGVAIADRAGAYGCRRQVREPCLLFAESQSSLSGGQVGVAPDLLFEFSAELVGMSAANPGSAGDGCQL